MLRRLLCFLGFHDWDNWNLKQTSPGYYDNEFYWEKECRCCGKTAEEGFLERN